MRAVSPESPTNMHQRTKQELGIAGIAVIVMFSLYGFGLSLIEKHARSVTGLLHQVRDERSKGETLTELKRVVAETALQRQELARYTISTEGVVGFIELVERLGEAAKVSLELTTVEVASGGADELLETLVLRFSATGKWAGIAHFLTLVESLPYAAVVDGVDIEKQSGTLWRASVTLLVYKDT